MTEDLIYLTLCCQLIEEKWQHGESKFWKNSDYQRLSEGVGAASRISISPDTLKRLFGKTKMHRTYNPQLETKNALAIFIGYESWEDFKRSHPLPVGEARPPAEPPPPVALPVSRAQPEAPTALLMPVPPASKARLSSRRYVWAAAVALGVVLLAAWYFVSVRRDGDLPAPDGSGNAVLAANAVVFNAKDTRDTVPHTVVFRYDISRLHTDSVIIDYGYRHFGYSEKELLPPQKRLITHYYHFPGIYTVSLEAGGRVLADVEVLSQGWAGAVYLKNQRMEAIDKKVLHYSNRRQGRLYLSPARLQAAGIDSALVDWLELSNFRSFGVDGDNFSLETRFRNDPEEGGFACLESMIRVMGERNLLRLQFNQPGCARWTTVQFGEIELDGKFNDLSPFSTPVSDWRVARLSVSNRRVRVHLDGSLVYQTAYRQPVGQVRGIVYNFRGFGSVDYVRLYDAKDKLVYADEFTE